MRTDAINWFASSETMPLAARCGQNTALMSAVKGLAARDRPLSSDARIGYRISECTSGAVPILQRSSIKADHKAHAGAFPCRGSAPACPRDNSPPGRMTSAGLRLTCDRPHEANKHACNCCADHRCLLHDDCANAVAGVVVVWAARWPTTSTPIGFSAPTTRMRASRRAAISIAEKAAFARQQMHAYCISDAGRKPWWSY